MRCSRLATALLATWLLASSSARAADISPPDAVITGPCDPTDAACLIDRLTEQVIRAKTAEKRLDESQKALATSEEMRSAAEKRASAAEARDDRLPWFLGGIGVAIVAGLTGALLAK